MRNLTAAGCIYKIVKKVGIEIICTYLPEISFISLEI